MTQQRAELVERLRSALAGREAVREVAMFGGRAFMVDGAMVVSALRSGDLLVRVDPDRGGGVVALPGATRAEMGAGRSMGPGWVSVAADAIADEAGLGFWLGVALDRPRRG